MTDKGDDDQRQERDQEAVPEPRIAALSERLDEALTGAETDAGEEGAETDLADHQIGTRGGVGRQAKLCPPATDDDGNDQRTAGETKLQRSGESGDHDR